MQMTVDLPDASRPRESEIEDSPSGSIKFSRSITVSAGGAEKTRPLSDIYSRPRLSLQNCLSHLSLPSRTPAPRTLGGGWNAFAPSVQYPTISARPVAHV